MFLERNIEAILDKDVLTYSSILKGTGMEKLSRRQLRYKH
jgi:hypothetical protein|tara:strand:- start:302 stop:421 length:120 start_codon:yes stop_codon:yes gene_type:complete